jgi:18S rRNA (guanine1575-N7)-methyltransferase
LVIDYPNSTKAKKLYLVLTLGGEQHQLNIVQGLSDEIDEEN